MAYRKLVHKEVGIGGGLVETHHLVTLRHGSNIVKPEFDTKNKILVPMPRVAILAPSPGLRPLGLSHIVSRVGRRNASLLGAFTTSKQSTTIACKPIPLICLVVE
jgi:hypothetical protein